LRTAKVFGKRNTTGNDNRIDDRYWDTGRCIVHTSHLGLLVMANEE
jgi:hypothetical protein